MVYNCLFRRRCDKKTLCVVAAIKPELLDAWMLRCPYCGYTAGKGGFLYKHMLRKHPEFIEDFRTIVEARARIAGGRMKHLLYWEEYDKIAERIARELAEIRER